MSTKQELFDKAARLVLAQGCAAVNGTGSCLYDTGDGKHCAIGLLMKDAGVPFPMYNGSVDSNLVLSEAAASVHAITPSDVTAPHLLGRNNIGTVFLRELQACHDMSAGILTLSVLSRTATPEEFLSQFRAAMINFAQKWKLDDKAVRS